LLKKKSFGSRPWVPCPLQRSVKGRHSSSETPMVRAGTSAAAGSWCALGSRSRRREPKRQDLEPETIDLKP